jgi:hypothetical protein
VLVNGEPGVASAVESRLYHPTGALDRIAARALGRG